MNITIRQATIDDANIIAHAVAMAIGEESVLDYCGNNYIDVLTEIAQYEDSQYSYLNALVAEVDGKSAGAIVGYDGALLEHLRKRTFSIIRKYNPRCCGMRKRNRCRRILYGFVRHSTRISWLGYRS